MRRIVFLFVFLFLGIPLLSWGVWQLWSARTLRVFILDKTSTTAEGNEHRSFNWVLTYNKFMKPNGSTYAVSRDYYGFFPLQNEQFLLKGLEQYTAQQVDSLVRRYEMAYFTDTYGVYRGDWYQRTRSLERSSLLYGGLQENDLLFLQAMKRQRKLVLAEFNFFASPTSDSIRHAAERMFDIHWTGWTGRYYSSLDTLDSDMPRWAIRLYEQQHREQWPFHQPGIILVHSTDSIVVLEEGTDLMNAVPMIVTREEQCEALHVPNEMPYPYWFDITVSGPSNIVAAEYSLQTTAAGDSLLSRHGIPKYFPAVIQHLQNYRFYYFAGDFADNPILGPGWARFKGLHWLRGSFYNREDPSERAYFFWEYFYPLLTAIVERYELEIHAKAQHP